MPQPVDGRGSVRSSVPTGDRGPKRSGEVEPVGDRSLHPRVCRAIPHRLAPMLCVGAQGGRSNVGLALRRRIPCAVPLSWAGRRSPSGWRTQSVRGRLPTGDRGPKRSGEVEPVGASTRAAQPPFGSLPCSAWERRAGALRRIPCARAVGVVGAVGGEQTLPAVRRATPLRLVPMLRVGAQRRRSCAIIRTSCRPAWADGHAPGRSLTSTPSSLRSSRGRLFIRPYSNDVAGVGVHARDLGDLTSVGCANGGGRETFDGPLGPI